MDDYDRVLQRQREIVESIQRVEANFKKDSDSRKTDEYLRTRLQALETLWEEFEKNNMKLLGAPDQTGEYFVEKVFQQMQMLTDKVRTILSNYRFGELSTPKAKDAEQQQTSKLNEFFNEQKANFRAFQRLLNYIDVDKITEKWELEDELHNLQTRWEHIDTLHSKIDNLLLGSDKDYEERYSVYEKKYRLTKKALNQKLSATTHLYKSTPQMELPNFYGDYSQWPTFLDLYKSAIHDNPLLSKAQKMQHLKGRLRGEALRLVQHLSVTAENYLTAWDLLYHRYNNHHLLFSRQIEIFLNQPTIYKQSSHDIRKLHDTTMECVHAIHNLGIDTTTWDPLLVHLLTKKLDPLTLSDYKESRKAPRDLPTLEDFTAFLETKFIALEPVSKREREPAASSASKQLTFRPKDSASCTPQRTSYNKPSSFNYKSNVLCVLCNVNHAIYQCKKFESMSPDVKLKTVTKYGMCKNCLYVHERNVCNSTKTCKICHGKHNTLLHDSVNELEAQGSRPAFVPKQQPRQQYNWEPSSNHVANCNGEILLTTVLARVRANDNTYVTLRCLLDQGSQISLITESAAQRLGLPRRPLKGSVTGIGESIKKIKGKVQLECKSIHNDHTFTTHALVMPKLINSLPSYSFDKPSFAHIQHLQLADPDFNVSKPIDILLDAKVYSDIIMSGLVRGTAQQPIAQQTQLGWIISGCVNQSLNCNVIINNVQDIANYWEMEEISEETTATQEEQFCEQLYTATTRRLPDGKYEVRLPMKEGFEAKLGQSKSKALAQFNHLEQHLQKIVWRSRPQDFLKEYTLCTLTYGMKAAPFLALRTMAQLAVDEADKYPLGTKVLQKDFYVDDLLSGCNTIEQARETQHQLIDMLRGAGMNLRKWASNKPQLLSDLSPNQINQCIVDIKNMTPTKALGLQWNPITDTFMFLHADKQRKTSKMTKRILLSEISKIFDPLGWISPVTIRAKLLFQKVFLTGIEWDQEVPPETKHEWMKIQDDLHDIDKLNIPRWIGGTTKTMTVHGFCDASEKVYACVIYLTSINDKGDVITRMIAAKTKLSPKKKTLTLPRLELSSAVLLSKLMSKVLKALPHNNIPIYGWTDSLIVLGWLQGNLTRWKTFVANRISQIIDIMPSKCWRHVSSQYNAADCATRGLSTTQLISHSLWWDGPGFIKHDIPDNVDKIKLPQCEVKLIPNPKTCAVLITSSVIEDLLEKYEKDIETIAKREDHIFNLYKNQTSILEAHNNILKRNEFIMKSQFTSIVRTLHNLTEDINQAQTTSLRILNSFSLLSSMVAANVIISNLRRIQDTLLDTITDIYHGRLNVHLLPPEQIQQQLELISGHLQGDLTIPVDNIGDLYGLLHIQARVTRKSLIMEIRLPLLNRNQFELDEIISIPRKKGNTTFYTSTGTKYIAINVKKDTVIPMTETDTLACISHKNNHRLCPLNHPVYTMKVGESICDMQLMINDNNKPYCQAAVKECANRWIKLHARDTWLFTYCNEHPIRVICPNGVTTQQLIGTGLVVIPSGCSVRGKSFAIHSQHDYKSQIYIQNSYLEPPKISPINDVIKTSLPEEIKLLTEDHNSEFLDMSQKIKAMKEQNLEQLPRNDNTHYIVIYVILGAISLAITTLIICKLKRRCQLKPAQPDTPLQEVLSAVAPAGPGKMNTVRQRTTPNTDIPMTPQPQRRVSFKELGLE